MNHAYKKTKSDLTLEIRSWKGILPHIGPANLGSAGCLHSLAQKQCLLISKVCILRMCLALGRSRTEAQMQPHQSFQAGNFPFYIPNQPEIWGINQFSFLYFLYP